MAESKHIERDGQSATTIFDNRGLRTDYRTLQPFLKKGMKVLDVGCGTGSISRDIAQIVGPSGRVKGIDNTLRFIESGRQTYRNQENLELIHCDLFDFESDEPFDLITSARALQWMSNPKKALVKMKSLLLPGGTISVLDYDHTGLEWNPEPPKSMEEFYSIFLKWREDAGLNNQMAKDLATIMQEIGLQSVEVHNSDEHYDRSRPDFHAKVGIWSQVAGSQQMVKEGYLDEELRLQAISDYDLWVEKEAVSMTMKLNEVRSKSSP